MRRRQLLCNFGDIQNWTGFICLQNQHVRLPAASQRLLHITLNPSSYSLKMFIDVVVAGSGGNGAPTRQANPHVEHSYATSEVLS